MCGKLGGCIYFAYFFPISNECRFRGFHEHRTENFSLNSLCKVLQRTVIAYVFKAFFVGFSSLGSGINFLHDTSPSQLFINSPSVKFQDYLYQHWPCLCAHKRPCIRAILGLVLHRKCHPCRNAAIGRLLPTRFSSIFLLLRFIKAALNKLRMCVWNDINIAGERIEPLCLENF